MHCLPVIGKRAKALLEYGHELLEKKIYDNLHVFGCPIFYHVTDSKLEKKKKNPILRMRNKSFSA